MLINKCRHGCVHKPMEAIELGGKQQNASFEHMIRRFSTIYNIIMRKSFNALYFLLFLCDSKRAHCCDISDVINTAYFP